MSGSAAILDNVRDLLARFVAFPSPHALTAVTLWAAHAHVITQLDSTPRLALVSPEPACGKSRTLEILELLVPRALNVLNASPAPIFREVSAGAEEEHPVTLLFDESDALFRPTRGDDPNLDLRAMLNAGHRRGATIPRCVGPKHEVVRFQVFAAAALAGIGNPPPTLASRSVIVRMRRRAPDERVEPFRYRLHSQEGLAARDRLEAWAQEASSEIERAEPVMPDGVVDRPADVWEPLLAVADVCGGHWPETARSACVTFTAATNEDEQTLGALLLRDLHGVFDGARALATKTILGELHALEESPWADLRGKPLDARGLARMLRPYGVASKTVKLEHPTPDGKNTAKGYHQDDLLDAWMRYLPDHGSPPSPQSPSNDDGKTMVTQVTEVTQDRLGGEDECMTCQRLGAPCARHFDPEAG